MRMSCEGMSAADVVNSLAGKDLADILYRFGEEKKSRQIADKIVRQRQKKRIETTKDLAEIVYTVIHRTPNAIDPATRTFQALRIFVNGELDELESGLKEASLLLKPAGRLAVVTFHSLEDRIVKAFFAENSGKTKAANRYSPALPKGREAIFAGGSKVLQPSPEESALNSRSRSAKLRFATKL